MNTYKVKQIDWDLIEDFNDRSSENFNLYYNFKDSGTVDLCRQVIAKGWFAECRGSIQANSLWDAYREGNIGERTFEGASISTGDILIDDEGIEYVLSDNDFERV